MATKTEEASDKEQNPEALTEEQFAEYLDLTANTLRRWRCEGRKNAPPFFLLGGLVRYSLSQFHKWADENKQFHNATNRRGVR